MVIIDDDDDDDEYKGRLEMVFKLLRSTVKVKVYSINI